MINKLLLGLLLFSLMIFTSCGYVENVEQEDNNTKEKNDEGKISNTYWEAFKEQPERPLKLLATIEYEGKFEVGTYSIRCDFENTSKSKSFFTDYILNNNFNELLQFYMFRKGQPVIDPDPVSILFPASVLPSNFNMPFSGEPDEIKPGKTLKLRDRIIKFEETGVYELWFTLFLPTDWTNIEDFEKSENGIKLVSNIIRVKVE